jgi:hypothetical protein
LPVSRSVLEKTDVRLVRFGRDQLIAALAR